MSRPNLRQTRQKQGEKGESRGLLPTLMVISKGCLNRLQLCFLFQILIGTKWKSTSMKSMLQDGRGQSVRQKHLRPNFANSRMAPPPGGGTRNELEKEAKRIEKEIDKKTGVVKMTSMLMTSSKEHNQAQKNRRKKQKISSTAQGALECDSKMKSPRSFVHRRRQQHKGIRKRWSFFEQYSGYNLGKQNPRHRFQNHRQIC